MYLRFNIRPIYCNYVIGASCILLRPDQFNFSKHGPDRPCFTGNENKIKKTAVFKKNSNISKTLEVLILKFSKQSPKANSILTHFY